MRGGGGTQWPNGVVDNPPCDGAAASSLAEGFLFLVEKK